MPRQFEWGGMPVPYITAWSAESLDQPPLIRRVVGSFHGIGYADEDPRADRDADTGALLARQALAPGFGIPVFAEMNGLRQRQAVRQMLCQVCGRPDPMRIEGGRSLYMVGSDTPIGEGETTTAPSVHPACALKSVEHCPSLHRGFSAALVEYSPVWGVAGVVHDPSTLDPRLPAPSPTRLTRVSVGSPDIPWTLAAALVISLHGITPISLDGIRKLAILEEAPC
ncbi:hypothetical protein [Streptomyces sp. NPDC048410]|uniref:hypothetical protein n=1 Tax=Streptomyces sp. NPDC048410 TaxID=3365545 RepID=UPI0037196B84